MADSMDELGLELAEHPENLRAAIKLGSACLKSGDHARARELFFYAAREFANRGFWLKAVCVAREITKFMPTDMEASAFVAHAFDELGLHDQAETERRRLSGLTENED